ncbi:hypothetical protein GPECTOR_53g83 [Gonium pectorale]|uniref:Uncharacterized protein n=1 Tax=Gonium pectorale TaxID=33097 RepID=A0A150G8A1_GONPE|nr:hypothetical protein GPECTOR_53g83 [Gonium pectorale]|eukprot:KXZ45590.1 hypothetical protein GPECTOR_53g83 [Gonium pectorale]
MKLEALQRQFQELYPQARYIPAAPFSTPDTAYRNLSMGMRGAGGVDAQSRASSPVLSPTVQTEQKLAALKAQIHNAHVETKQLDARLNAACSVPVGGLMQAVTAQLQKKGQNMVFRSSLEPPGLPSPIADSNTVTHSDRRHDAPLAPDVEHLPQQADMQTVASSLRALRSGLQGVLALQKKERQDAKAARARGRQPQQPPIQDGAHGNTLAALLAHVNVLEEQLLGAPALPPLPAPAAMLLPTHRRFRSQERYSSGLGASTEGRLDVAGGAARESADGESEADKPVTQPLHSSDPNTSESDLPLFMTIDALAPHHSPDTENSSERTPSAANTSGSGPRRPNWAVDGRRLYTGQVPEIAKLAAVAQSEGVPAPTPSENVDVQALREARKRPVFSEGGAAFGASPLLVQDRRMSMPGEPSSRLPRGVSAGGHAAVPSTFRESAAGAANPLYGSGSDSYKTDAKYSGCLPAAAALGPKPKKGGLLGKLKRAISVKSAGVAGAATQPSAR